ncbi:CRISPR-associated protein Csn1 [Bizionia gelidisalsuginis]|uniref:CRISPR-associated endonuclease Cas9 n=1 Tax=Bizionia gelidisalsuginis TaxID=291188 RepID=A0ABY3MD22_9FLAO|nr:type II CRISPR RNA-guided endonuclease Cas9 [Bizionia gelidisalsuginis]TYC16295.1 CRISPR-associated protein Csn1 [Bizionia gelidisalsuginis]
MKKILGLDLGTNSIGWALIEKNLKKETGEIKAVGTRIIPMSQDVLGKFDSGVSISQTAERTSYRSVRRLTQRNKLRRERLHRVLHQLNLLPRHYDDAIDFQNKLGQFKESTEVKLNYNFNAKGGYEFLFKDAFNEMIEDFKKDNPQLFYLKNNGKETKIPYDWTLYYLRKKALSHKITKEELSWLILNFNQKRGYYQLRGEDDGTDDKTKLKEFKVLKVKEIINSGEKVKGKVLYNVIFENDWLYDRQIVDTIEWENKTKEFIVTTALDAEGNPKIDKEGVFKRSFKKVDSEHDWIAIKSKTEQDIRAANKTVGEFIYETLLKNPTQKIRGSLVKTIERKFYREEFEKIITEQIKHHPEIDINTIIGKENILKCVSELYPRNEAHANNIINKDFNYLFTQDIIFYQRPLKSKKSEIANCQYEIRAFKKVNNKTGAVTKEKQPLKTIAKSHPLFQEFRLWQFLHNLKILIKKTTVDEKIQLDVDVTDTLLTSENDWAALFQYLNTKKELEQKSIIEHLISQKLILKSEKENYRWNYVEDKKYPGNETRVNFSNRLKKVKNLKVEEFLTSEIEFKLWHIIYSVTDKNEYEKALESFAINQNIDKESFVANFKKHPPFKSDYGAYSSKAIKKLLPLMRLGEFWNESNVPVTVLDKIIDIKDRLTSINYDENVFKKDENNLLKTIVDDVIPKQLLKSFIHLEGKNHLAGLNTYQACYLVYERHSESSAITQWKKPDDIVTFLNHFKQHSLRNPIVEQVVTETLRTVRDIWEYHGNSESNYFDEIHIELGREMKNPAGKREEISKRNTQNENNNQRIKGVLKELMTDGVKNIKPYSPSQQEILKIYDEGVSHNPDVSYAAISEDDILKIRKNSNPTPSEINKYKLWLEQGYVSPYTGIVIPLSDLFTTAYQIEHIIPQSRYFDNSLSNKVICESDINEDKSNKTAYEYIAEKGGSIVNGIKVLELEVYERQCQHYFKKNRTKLKNLLSEDIPEGFINRQLNDSRYISKLIKGLLSNIVREDKEQEAMSKNIVPVTGIITSKLKHDWGLNDKWNEIITPRFKRLNEMTNSEDFGSFDKKINTFRVQVPEAISRGFNKKRIDHRHHTLDALVIACCTKEHINYLTSLNTERKNYGLRDRLLIVNKNGHYTKHFKMPWNNFSVDCKKAIEYTIVSFKQNLRVINKTTNKYQSYNDENGNLRLGKDGKPKKDFIRQVKGDSWAVRKPMHKDTVSGQVTVKRIKKGLTNISNYLLDWHLIVDKEIKKQVKKNATTYKCDLKLIKKHLKDNPITIDSSPVTKIKVFEYTKNATATRVALSEKFTRKQLDAITDSGIQQILNNHLLNYLDEKDKETFDLAFNTDGLEQLNKNIIELNNGKKHQPIYKVRLYEEGSKFSISENKASPKSKKMVEAAKGTNLFFSIYWNEDQQKRVYETIPFNIALEHQKQVAHLPKEEQTAVPTDATKGTFLFTLSPNDLVYIPSDEELNNPTLFDVNNLLINQTNRIYKMVSSTGSKCHFINSNVASLIKSYDSKTKIGEFGSLNKLEVTTDLSKPKRIKEHCWKLKIDRLGNIINVIH